MARNLDKPGDRPEKKPHHSMLGRIDEICDAFESEWKSGRRPRIEDYLGNAGEGDRNELLRELLAVEIQWRQKHGELPQRHEYSERFTKHLDIIDALLASAVQAEPSNAACPPGSDHNLLFGILALQMDFITRDQLVEGMNAWVLDKSKALGEILVERGALSQETRVIIEVLVAKHEELHGNDPQQSLAAVAPRIAIPSDLKDINDDEVQKSLQSLIVPEGQDLFASTVAAPSVGDTISYFGDYELLDVLGRGGMGVVYKARQVSLDRTVALKMILSGQLSSEREVARFHAEAEAAAKLDHPGIVPIHEIGEHNGQHYFSMGYVEGTSLASKLRDGPLSAKEATTLVQQVAEAVQHAHDHGIIHRDLKPANVLLDKEGQPRLTDFGLAKRLESDSELTASGQVMGSPAYMSPEQAEGRVKELGPATDIYSLGTVLYSLLTGRPPFLSDTVADTLMQVINQEPVSPRRLNSKCPRDLETICLKCLRKEPAKRYASAADLAADLGRWLNHEPIHARPVSRREKIWLWCKRRPAVAAMTAAIVLLVVIASFVGYEIRAQARAEALVGRLLDAKTTEVPAIIRGSSSWVLA